MNCKFCGRETEYAHFQDGTVCCELCNKEKARLLRENVRMKMEENKELVVVEEKSKDELIKEYTGQIQELLKEKEEFEKNARTTILIYINKIRYLQQQIENLINP